jgi:hypothetical protein
MAMTSVGSSCSLLPAAAVNLAEIADEAGNSVEVLSSNYLGVIKTPSVRCLRHGCVIRRVRLRLREPRTAWLGQALFRTRTGDPLLTMEVLYQLS